MNMAMKWYGYERSRLWNDMTMKGHCYETSDYEISDYETSGHEMTVSHRKFQTALDYLNKLIYLKSQYDEDSRERWYFANELAELYSCAAKCYHQLGLKKEAECSLKRSLKHMVAVNGNLFAKIPELGLC